MPDKEIAVGEFAALLDTDTLPLALPAAFGSNVTFSVAVWLGASVVPAVTPVALNPVPDGATLEIVTLEFPLFINVTLKVLLLPIGTLPKLKLPGLVPSDRAAANPDPLNESPAANLSRC